MTRPSPGGAQQYQTHRQLIARTSAKLGTNSLDAVIVPASRPAVNLDHAVTLARGLRCHLVVLCSHKARAADVNELLASRNFNHNRAVIVDLPGDYAHPMLSFATSRLAGLDLPDGSVSPNRDLSTKRNLGLLLARMLGWQRIFFLDDDIRDLNSSDLEEAAWMLGSYQAVGMRAVNYPDNSIVCHGHRQTGAYQDVFVSGSALAVHCAGQVTFFPNIYNEDWFFFYHAAADRRLGWSGRNSTQLCYDPFADPQRAAGQEFGDVMAEGLYSLLHYRIYAEHATSDYWRAFLDSRMRFLEAVLVRAANVEQYLQARIVRSIEAAMACSSQITPSMCERYIALWNRDLGSWKQSLRDIPELLSVNAALRELSLAPSGRNPRQLAGIIGGNGGGVPRGFTAGEVLIPLGLTLHATDIPKSIEAPQVPAAITNGGLSMMRDVLQERQGGDGSTKGVFNWMGRVLQPLAAKERSEPDDTDQRRESSRLPTGRHRRSAELLPAALSTGTEGAYMDTRPSLAGVSLASGPALGR